MSIQKVETNLLKKYQPKVKPIVNAANSSQIDGIKDKEELTTNKILLALGGLAVLGAAIYIACRNGKTSSAKPVQSHSNSNQPIEEFVQGVKKFFNSENVEIQGVTIEKSFAKNQNGEPFTGVMKTATKKGKHVQLTYKNGVLAQLEMTDTAKTVSKIVHKRNETGKIIGKEKYINNSLERAIYYDTDGNLVRRIEVTDWGIFEDSLLDDRRIIKYYNGMQLNTSETEPVKIVPAPKKSCKVIYYSKDNDVEKSMRREPYDEGVSLYFRKNGKTDYKTVTITPPQNSKFYTIDYQESEGMITSLCLDGTKPPECFMPDYRKYSYNAPNEQTQSMIKILNEFIKTAQENGVEAKDIGIIERGIKQLEEYAGTLA